MDIVLERKLLDYLEYKKIKTTKYGKKILSTVCPSCNTATANIFSTNPIKSKCYTCSKEYSIVDYVSIYEKIEKDKVEDFLRDLFRLNKTDSNEVERAFEFYSSNNFGMAPARYNTKASFEPNWTQNPYYKKEDWEQFIKNNLNINVITGETSGITVLDIDILSTKEKNELYSTEDYNIIKELQKKIVLPEKLKSLLSQTARQKSSGGFHFIYKYDSDFKNKALIETEGLSIEIMNNGGSFLTYPSSLNGLQRKFVTDEIKEMPKELKGFLLSNITSSTNVRLELPTEVRDSNGEVGHRNIRLTKLGGILRKHYTIQDTANILTMANNIFPNPLPRDELQTTINSLGKYQNSDDNIIEKNIVDYLKCAKSASKAEIQYAVFDKLVTGDAKKTFDQTLVRLISNKIIIKNHNLYEIKEEMDWSDNTASVGTPVGFKVPYFNDIAEFHWGDMLVLGSQTGIGKCIRDGMILTNQGMRDISEYGKLKKEGKSNVTKHLRVHSGYSKHKTYHNPNYFWKERINDTYRITTYHGFTLEGTPDHPIKVRYKINEHSYGIKFKKLKNITGEDFAILTSPKIYPKENIRKKRKIKFQINKHMTNLKDWIIPDINVDVAKLFGYILGDGTCGKAYVNIYQDSKNISVIKDIEHSIKNIGLEYKIKTEKNMTIVKIHSAIFSYFVKIKLFNINFRKKKYNVTSPNRKIPKYILNSSEECQKAFIGAIMSCESHLSNKHLSITMASKHIISTLQLMLLNMGIISRKTIKKVKEYPNNNYYNLFFIIDETIKLIENCKPSKYEDFNILKSQLKYKKIKRINNQFKKDYYFADKIIGIEKKHYEDGVYVYDFNMSDKYDKNKNHQFWSNGFVSHNTTIAMNIIKKIVEQEIKPYYIYNEPGGRFAKTANKLGLTGQFWHTFCSRPEKAILKDNSVTIMDWVKPPDFARTDNTYGAFAEMLEETNSFMVCFAQLTKDDKPQFFARNQIDQFASLSAKYLYDESSQGIFGNWHIEKIRDPKMHIKSYEIPCHYNFETKEHYTIEEKERHNNEEKQNTT